MTVSFFDHAEIEALRSEAERLQKELIQTHTNYLELLRLEREAYMAVKAEADRLRTIASEALAYASPHNYDAETEDYEQVFRAALTKIVTAEG